MPARKWSIVGTVGVPGNYGGFETLAENLVRFHARHDIDGALSVYCSSKAFKTRFTQFERADLRYIGLAANGPQSILYDILSLFDASRRQTNVILLLGVSGALALPLVRALSRCRIVTNIDGIEWRREKWTGIARLFLRWSERAAVRWSDVVVADNAAIAEYVQQTYGQPCQVIAYGGDHALNAAPVAMLELQLPRGYALALCRIEPENNVAMVLEAFAQMPEHQLVFVGNWNRNEYGRELRNRYRNAPNIYIVDSIFDAAQLRWVRDGASIYVHGHSAGGTNPSLVEMMHFGVPVLAYDCIFNRITTENRASYFDSVNSLKSKMERMSYAGAACVGQDMFEIANRRFTWKVVATQYFDLLKAQSD